MPDDTSPIPIHKPKVADTADMKQALEAVLKDARADMPADYDVESAFADVLSLATVDTSEEVEPALVRVAMWLFEQLPKSAA